jgi:hypothetical protein
MQDRLAVLSMPTLSCLAPLVAGSRRMPINTQSPRASAEDVLAYFRCPDEFLPTAHSQKPLSAGKVIESQPTFVMVGKFYHLLKPFDATEIKPIRPQL